MSKPDVLIPGPLGQTPSRGLPWSWSVYAKRVQILLHEFGIRSFDVLISLGLLLMLSPVMLVLAVLSRAVTGRVFDREPLIGRWGIPFDHLSFAISRDGFAKTAVLFNVLNGSMALLGPRPLTLEEAASPRGEVHWRLVLRPGLISTFSLRNRMGIAYEEEAVLDELFFYEETLKGNIGLLGRALIGRLITGGVERKTPDRFELLGCPIVNTTMGQAIDWISKQLQGSTTRMAAFVNPDCLNIAYRNKAYLDVLQQSDVVWPDGVGINVGLRLLGLSLKDNVNGTDMFPRLCERLAAEGRSIYLLGARPEIAKLAASNMVARYPNLVIAGTRDGYFSAEDEDSVIEHINASGADVLLTALGAPRQELWLNKHLTRLRPRVVIGVGGLFDFYSGRISRAPTWMREIGLEWIWRLMQEPGRMWRRYIIGNPLFLYRVYRQKLFESSE